MAWEAACTAVVEGLECECKDCHRISTGFIPPEYVKVGYIDDSFWEIHGCRDDDYIDEMEDQIDDMAELMDMGRI